MNDQPHQSSNTPSHQLEVEDRFGVLPNFFRLAPDTPEVAENLWGFAKFGYLDNPLPSLLKERLFVYLSQFCEVRYCITRHVGFLVGLGRPSGDRECPPETVEQIVRLLRRPLPRAESLDPHLQFCEAREAPVAEFPESDTFAEEAIFACATHVFLQTVEAPRCLQALSQVLDAVTYQHLLVFLTFVRTAHFWTKLHPELKHESDITELLSVHEVLAQCVLHHPEEETSQTTQLLLDELGELRKERDRAELLRVTLASIGDAVIATDPQGRVTTLNTVAEELTGWPCEEATGQPLESVFQIVNEVTRQPVESPATKALRDGVTVGLANHTVLVAKDGSERAIDDSAAPIRSKAGEVVGCVLVFRDVTERRNSERTLSEQSRLLRLGAEIGTALTMEGGDLQAMLQASTESMVHNLDAALARIWTLNDDENVLELQASAGIYTHINGGHARVPVGKYKIGLIAHERKPHLTNSVAGDPRIPEQDWAQRQGLVAFAGYPLIVEDRVVGVMGMFARQKLSDITLEAMASVATKIALAIQNLRNSDAERKALLEAQESREILRTTLGSIGDAVISTDSTGKVAFLNTVAESLTGWTNEKAIGVPLTDVFHIVNESTRKVVENPALRALKEGVIVGLANHTILIAKDGAERPIDDSAAPIRDGDGNVTGSVLIFRDISERQRVQRSERLLASVVESSDDAIVSKSLDGIIQSWNTAAERIFGYTKEEAVGRHISLLIPDERAGEEEQIIDRLRRGERVQHFETVRVRSDGQRLYVSLTISPIKNAEGAIIGASKIARDISERKQANEERIRLASVVENSSDYIGISDVKGNPLFINQAGRKLVGLPANVDVRSTKIPDYFVPEEREFIQSVVIPTMINEGRWQGELNFQHYQTGAAIPVWYDLFRVDDRKGKPINFATVTRDLTERKQAVAALQESEEKLRLLADTIPQLAWMAHPDGNIFWYNNRWYDYTGKSPSEMEGWGWQSVHDPEVLPDVLERWQHSISSGQAFDMVFPLKGADGRFRPFLTRINPLRDQDGDIRFWFGTNTDISDQQRIQEELRELAAQLSDADRRKTEFLATLGHELRNPLAPIRTGLEAMKLLCDDPIAIREIRNTMERQVQQMVRLIDDLLDISRITQGKMVLRTCRVDLAEVVQSAVEATRSYIDEAGHELTVELPPQPIILNADPSRLAQVLSNLINNAAKYTPDGGNIRLSAECYGHEVSVMVKDNGLGLPANMLGNIFEMFTQIDRSLEEGYTGLGIGLTLVKRLVELHGGSVEVSSEGAGKGSEFRVRIPVLVESSDTEEVEKQLEVGKALRILIVDDNKDAAKMLSMVVKMLGNEVDTAHDGLEAIEVAARFRPDVVLMDLGMPKMNGYEAAAHIRKQPWGKDILLVALTGWGQDDDKRRTKEAGFDHHLVKPAEPAALQTLLGEYQPKSS